MRLGVVCLIGGAAGAEIQGLRRACADPMLEQVGPHLTFVPPVNVRDVDAAVAVVGAAARDERGPFRLDLGPVTTFHPATPVVYLAVGGADAVRLPALQRRLLSGELDRPPQWPYVPHVTVVHGAEPERITATVAALSAYRTSVVLDRLSLLREGADRVWVPVADFAFGPPAVVGRGGLPLELAVSDAPAPDAARFFEREWAAHLDTADGPEARPARSFAVTARREGDVVAVATGSVTEGEVLSLDRLVVGASCRRQGVGAHVLAEVERLARSRGCTRAVLVARAGGAAVTFYRSRGWEIAYPLPQWRGSHDFVRMERRLSTS